MRHRVFLVGADDMIGAGARVFVAVGGDEGEPRRFEHIDVVITVADRIGVAMVNPQIIGQL